MTFKPFGWNCFFEIKSSPLFICFRFAENDQSRTGIQRVMDWASSLETDKSLSDDDIIISASVDEVMAPETLVR